MQLGPKSIYIRPKDTDMVDRIRMVSRIYDVFLLGSCICRVDECESSRRTNTSTNTSVVRLAGWLSGKVERAFGDGIQ